MKNDNTREGIVRRLREKVARGEPIIGAGAGSGLSTKAEEAGGIDLIIVYNSGRFRMAGRGSCAGLMPYGNANQIVKEMGLEILPVVKETPVLAGVCGTDPFMIPRLLLEELRALGFSGIQNFPTVGLWTGEMRQTLEETGMSYELEGELVARAHEMDFLTTPYVFDEAEARLMTKAGADLVVAHLGPTAGGTIGAKTTKPLSACIERVRGIVAACKETRDDVLVLCHGGPLVEPEDAQQVMDAVPGLVGFYGASVAERLPAETAIAEQIRRFRRCTLPRASRG